MAHLAQEARRVGLGVVIGLMLLGLLVVPQALRAEEDALFFATTGHWLDNQQGFLSFWRAHDGERLLGAAVTGVLDENGMPVQYFERGRLETHAELEGAPVMLGRIGADYAAGLWRSFEAAPAEAPAADVAVFDATGHTLRGPFRDFWNTNNGMAMFGYPLSEPLWEQVGDQMLLVQYFERGRLEHRPMAIGTPDEVAVSALGREVALLRNLPMAPAAAPAAPAVEAPAPAAPAPAAPAPAPAPKPARRAAREAPAATSGGGKRITVDLGAQWLYAYEGDTLVFDAPVSTGRDGFNTPAGDFRVYAKLSKQTMSGTIGGEYYNVPNVPSVMYINGGVALHGTYWHNNFGIRRMSHGCINLPLNAATWLYRWAPMGTPVHVGW